MCILFMFCLAPIIGGGIKLYDFMYPAGAAKIQKNAAIDAFHEKLTECYKVADPTKLKNVSKLASSIYQPTNDKWQIHNGKSKERAFWAKMMEKYGKHDACHR